MNEIYVRRVNNAFIAADGCSQDVIEGLKFGVVYHVNIKASRKYKFLQKAFVLVRYAFDLWEPEIEHKGVTVQKNFDRFRDDLTVIAGFYKIVYSLNENRVMKVPLSWSYKEMPDDEDFSKLYSALVQVVLDRVATNYTGEELDRIVNNILHGFG